MPRSSRGSSPRAAAPSRPAPAPARAPAQQQQRPMSTQVAKPPTQQQQAPPAQASGGSGLFGQMASTAAGVAVGSSIGHAIGGFFGGGSSQPAAEQQQQYQQPADSYAQPGGAMDSNLYNSSTANQAAGPCAMNIKQYTDCMTQNQGDMNICGWYLDQLRACQQAAKQY